MFSEKHRYTQCIVLAVVALGIFVYSNTLAGEFVWDDASSILLHRSVQDPSAVLQLFQEDQHAYAIGQGNFYRPLLAITFMVDFWLSYSGPTIHESTAVTTQLSPLLFHIDSIFWHCLAGLMLVLLLGNLESPRSVQAAVPLLYIVHPLHTEAVAYISGRADSMSAAFMFGGLYIATRKTQENLRWLHGAAVLLCFVAALLSKESSFIFFVLLALTYLTINKVRENSIQTVQWATCVGTGLILLVYALLRMGNGPLNFGSDSRPITSTISERAIESPQALAYYIELLIVPSQLHMERSLETATTTAAALGFLALILCLALAIYGLRRKQYRIALAALWFLVTWFPISGLPMALNAPMAEHWMYVPMVGFLWAIMESMVHFGESRLPERSARPFQYALGVVLCGWGIFLTLVAIDRNLDWRSNQSIYEATLRKNPNTSRVHFNLAVTYESLLGNVEGAKRHYGDVLALHQKKKQATPALQSQLWEEEIQSHFSLGQIHMKDQQYSDAMRHLSILASLQVNESNRTIVGLSMFELGKCFLYMGDPPRAQQVLQQAISVLPALNTEVANLIQNY